MSLAEPLGHKHDRGPFVTVGLILALGAALIVVWRLGLPTPLLIVGLFLACAAACLLLALMDRQSRRRAEAFLARSRGTAAEAAEAWK